MAAVNQPQKDVIDLSLDDPTFPDPEEFPSYDDVESEDGEAEVQKTTDNFTTDAVDFDNEGCGCTG